MRSSKKYFRVLVKSIIINKQLEISLLDICIATLEWVYNINEGKPLENEKITKRMQAKSFQSVPLLKKQPYLFC